MWASKPAADSLAAIGSGSFPIIVHAVKLIYLNVHSLWAAYGGFFGRIATSFVIGR